MASRKSHYQGSELIVMGLPHVDLYSQSLYGILCSLIGSCILCHSFMWPWVERSSMCYGLKCHDSSLSGLGWFVTFYTCIRK